MVIIEIGKGKVFLNIPYFESFYSPCVYYCTSNNFDQPYVPWTNNLIPCFISRLSYLLIFFPFTLSYSLNQTLFLSLSMFNLPFYVLLVPLFVYLSQCVCLLLSISLSCSLTVSVRMSVCLPVYLPACLPVSLCLSVSLSLSVSLFLFLCLSVSVSLFLSFCLSLPFMVLYCIAFV